MNTRKIALSGAITLAVLIAMLTVVPSALATYPANSTYFVPENSTGVYCEDNTVVQVRLNTSVPSLGGMIDISFDPNCVNITAADSSGSPWTQMGDFAHYGTYARMSSFNWPGGPTFSGDNLFANITLHCINDTSNCSSYLNFRPGHVDVSDANSQPIIMTTYNGTINCTTPPINVDIRADSITGNIFDVASYTVNPGTVTDTDGSHTINNHTAMGAMMVYCRDNGINVNISTGTWGNWTVQIGSNASDFGNWMYAVDETSPGYSADLYALSGGEKVHFFNYNLPFYKVLTTLNTSQINVDDYINATVTWKNTTGTHLLSGASVNVSTMGAWYPNVGPSVGTTGADGNVTFQWSSPGTWGVYAVDPVHGSGQYNLPSVTFTCNYTILSCDDNGVEKNAFVPGENVSVKGTGLDPNTNYTLWIQDANVSDGDVLSAGEDPSVTQESVLTDANGNFNQTLIWNISAGAAITHHKYDIVADNQDTGTVGTYNATDDDIDAAQVEGFVAPVPEMATIALFGFGLLTLAGYVGLGQRRKRK